MLAFWRSYRTTISLVPGATPPAKCSSLPRPGNVVILDHNLVALLGHDADHLARHRCHRTPPAYEKVELLWNGHRATPGRFGNRRSPNEIAGDMRPLVSLGAGFFLGTARITPLPSWGDPSTVRGRGQKAAAGGPGTPDTMACRWLGAETARAAGGC